MKRNVLNSPGLLEFKKRRHKVFLKKILLLLFGILAFFSLLAFLSRLDNFNINSVKILGNNVLETEAIEKLVNEQMSGYYLWFFPKTNFILYPQDTLVKELKNKFKRIKDISINDKNIKTLEVSLTEREAKYTWCGDSAELRFLQDSENKCYFVDEDGYVFDEAPYFSGNIYFKFYGTQSESYFSKQNFKQLISFRDVLVDMGLKPIALYMTNDGDIQIFLSSMNPSSMEPKIILKADADFQNVAENLQVALDTEPLKSKFKNKYSTLEYIDLRFGNKVYDKFQ